MFHTLTLPSSPARLLVALLVILPCSLRVAEAQINSGVDEATAERFGPPQAVRHRCGVSITASRGAVRDIRAMVAVPLECPEQEVRLIDEDFSAEVGKAEFRPVAGGEAQQLFIRIPYLPDGKEAHAILTYEVLTRTVSPPEASETAELVVPRRVDRDLRRYLQKSPYIDVRDRAIREAVEAALASVAPEADASGDSSADSAVSGSPSDRGGEPTAWQRVEAFYDYALEHVEYQEGDDKPAVAALEDGVGDCQAVSAVFVAMCRTAKIPARMVWVKDHQYAEFYLEDAAGEGSWYPIESAGTRSFGGMPTARTILQKGDNFKVPERPREALRYASDHLKGFPTPGGGKPKVRYIREEF